MRNLQLERFPGNLSAYELQRIKTWKHLTKMKEAKDKQKKHIQATIEQNIQAAKRSGDDKKLKTAASRKKKINDRWGMEVRLVEWTALPIQTAHSSSFRHMLIFWTPYRCPPRAAALS